MSAVLGMAVQTTIYSSLRPATANGIQNTQRHLTHHRTSYLVIVVATIVEISMSFVIVQKSKNEVH